VVVSFLVAAGMFLALVAALYVVIQEVAAFAV
jgi:hypothetical protein